MSPCRVRREGAAVLESALVLPLFFLLVLGLVVAGLGVFRYQELASLAREATRYASVRGAAYEFRTGQKAATAEEILEKIIKPRAHGMDLQKLECTVTWSPDNRQGSQVTVHLKYRWIPEAFGGGVDLSSKSKTLISY